MNEYPAWYIRDVIAKRYHVLPWTIDIDSLPQEEVARVLTAMSTERMYQDATAPR